MTKYEKSLSKRVAEVGDKFILRGDVYEAVAIKDTSCTGCIFNKAELCGRAPDCGENYIIFIKEVVV